MGDILKTMLLLAGLLATAAAPPAAAACAPAKLVKIATRNVTPGIPADSWMRQPLVMHRKGEHYFRNEEPRDAARKLHMMMVVSAPDIWFVNKESRSGQHIVDPGPTYDVHAPIIGFPTAPKAFVDLEYGCEAQFVRDKSMAAQGPRDAAGATTYALAEGQHRLEIKLAANERPTEVSYLLDGKPVLQLQYDVYEPGLPDQPALFAEPEGFTYVEQRPGN